MKSRIETTCGRQIDGKDTFLSELDLPHIYEPILQIMRFYMQSFLHPDSQSWTRAMAVSEEAFGDINGPQIAVRTLKALQNVRYSRRSPFNFNSPDCPSCSGILTEHERRFIVTLKCINSKLSGSARMEILMLCEGNEVDHVLTEMENLNHLMLTMCTSPSSPSARDSGAAWRQA